MSTCRDCDRTIQWAVSEATGKAMPIDMTAHEHGNVYFTGKHGVSDKGLRGPVVHVLKKDEETLEPRFQSHHQTCPEGRYQQSVRSKARPPKEALAAVDVPVPEQGTLL